MDSDTYSNSTVYNTVSHFNNSDLETSDKFDNSERSPSTFSHSPFQPLHSQIRFEILRTFSPLTSEPSDNNSSVNTQISHELDNFITLQQQLQHPQTLTIHQLSQSVISSNPSTPIPSTKYIPSRYPSFASTPSSSSTNRASKRNSPILHFTLTQEQPKHLLIAPTTLTLKNSFKFVYPFSANTPTLIQTLMTNTLILLMSTYYTQHFHGHHFITSLIHCHYHYITPHMITNNAALNLPVNNSTRIENSHLSDSPHLKLRNVPSITTTITFLDQTQTPF